MGLATWKENAVLMKNSTSLKKAMIMKKAMMTKGNGDGRKGNGDEKGNIIEKGNDGDEPEINNTSTLPRLVRGRVMFAAHMVPSSCIKRNYGKIMYFFNMMMMML